MRDLIDRHLIAELVDAHGNVHWADIAELPSEQPDSGYIAQIKWERDLAIQQLKDLGYGLGEKPRTNGDTVSRQLAIDACHNWDEGKDAYAYGDMVEERLQKLPSAQPKIIRCKDCEHYKFADNRAFGFPVKRCEWTGFEDVDDDDFCSRAERRRNE